MRFIIAFLAFVVADAAAAEEHCQTLAEFAPALNAWAEQSSFHNYDREGIYAQAAMLSRFGGQPVRIEDCGGHIHYVFKTPERNHD